MIDLELCCLVNPVIGTNKLPCYCVHCHRPVCDACSKDNLFSKGEGTGIAWFHHKQCKALCTQDVAWHESYPRIGSCMEHAWCTSHVLKSMYSISEKEGVGGL